MSNTLKTYNHLIQLATYEDRLAYLRLYGQVSYETFGPFRYLNQRFYRSPEWKAAKNYVLVRDNGCDLGLPGYEIPEYHIRDKVLYKGISMHGIHVHHMNPVTLEQLQNGDPDLTNPDYLITVSLSTHNLIHYGNDDSIPRGPAVRTPGDTLPWIHK